MLVLLGKVDIGLNGVRPRWPEQCGGKPGRTEPKKEVSMESGLDGRNNEMTTFTGTSVILVSMESGLDGRNNGSPQKAALTRNFTSTCELSAPPGPIKPLC